MVSYAFVRVLILIPAIPFEVFFGCGGEDTRKSFTDHLYTAFNEAGIRTFRNDDGIPVGENIELAIKRAIYESKVSVIVFSKDYATSVRCLDELVMIMERRTIDGYIVVPVFYHVDPSDVGEQTGTYGEAFAEHEKQLKERMDRVEGWKSALKEVADINGMTLNNRYESQFIRDIVEATENKLNRKRTNIVPYVSWSNFFQIMVPIILIISHKLHEANFSQRTTSRGRRTRQKRKVRGNFFLIMVLIILIISPLGVVFVGIKSQGK